MHAFDVAIKKSKLSERHNDRHSLFSASSLKSWSCYRCGKRYIWRDSLQKHLRVECGKDPTFQCPICGRKFKHKHRWQSHARLIHYINIWPNNELIDESWSNQCEQDILNFFFCYINSETISRPFFDFFSFFWWFQLNFYWDTYLIIQYIFIRKYMLFLWEI